ncbi:MAG: 2-hydroxychromene-2-carboxylate isomerase [Solirubrobacteraceae bacterium]
MPQATFYFDLGSPFAYLTAERLEEHLPEPIAWQPVLLGGLFKLNRRSSWALGDADRRKAGMTDVERRARAQGLPSLRWPDPWPTDYLFAMRVATFAFRSGHGREFTMRAFRAAFQEGRDLSVPEHVLAAAAAAGIDPHTAGEAADDPVVKAALRDATDAAHERGVFGVPTVAIGEELFWGDDRLRDAAVHRARSGVE